MILAAGDNHIVVTLFQQRMIDADGESIERYSPRRRVRIVTRFII